MSNSIVSALVLACSILAATAHAQTTRTVLLTQQDVDTLHSIQTENDVATALWVTGGIVLAGSAALFIGELATHVCIVSCYGNDQHGFLYGGIAAAALTAAIFAVAIGLEVDATSRRRGVYASAAPVPDGAMLQLGGFF